MTNMTCLIRLTGITEMEIEVKESSHNGLGHVAASSPNPKKPIGLKLLWS